MSSLNPAVFTSRRFGRRRSIEGFGKRGDDRSIEGERKERAGACGEWSDRASSGGGNLERENSGRESRAKTPLPLPTTGNRRPAVSPPLAATARGPPLRARLIKPLAQENMWRLPRRGFQRNRRPARAQHVDREESWSNRYSSGGFESRYQAEAIRGIREVSGEGKTAERMVIMRIWREYRTVSGKLERD